MKNLLLCGSLLFAGSAFSQVLTQIFESAEAALPGGRTSVSSTPGSGDFINGDASNGNSATFAQDLTSKRGENFLPKAGDWAISINASPLLTYIQGIFGSEGAGANQEWSFLNGNNVITGKYFTSDVMAFRGGINIGFMSSTSNAYALKFGSTTGELVTDTRKTSGSNIMLTGGMEWRKGSTRLQGFYGAELGIGFGGGSKTEYTYGNAYDVVAGFISQTHAVDGSSDIVSVTNKGGLLFGLRGFIGAEYFVLPKLAIGGEFGWSLGMTTTGEGSRVDSQLNTGGTAMEDITTKTFAKGSTFAIGTDNSNPFFGPAGSLRLTFYF